MFLDEFLVVVHSFCTILRVFVCFCIVQSEPSEMNPPHLLLTSTGIVLVLLIAQLVSPSFSQQGKAAVRLFDQPIQ